MAYAQSKLANLPFAVELQRRLAGIGSQVVSVAAHPGIAMTEGAISATNTRTAVNRAFFRSLSFVFGQSPRDACLPILFAATAPEIRGGELIGPRGFVFPKLGGVRGDPGVESRTPEEYDPAIAEHLWELPAQLTNVDFACLANNSCPKND